MRLFLYLRLLEALSAILLEDNEGVYMNKVIGLLAHVDAGKTTFAEQILFSTNSIRSLGRVDHGNTFLDTHFIERERGITVFSEQAVFTYNENKYFLLDTPGHFDFSAEMERSVKVLDYAVLIISAVEGIQGHTEAIWNILNENNVPVFLFINKTDRDTADKEKVISDLNKMFSENIIPFDDAFQNPKSIEKIAETSDKLIEYYLENGFDQYVWTEEIKKLIKKRKLFLCFSGSALLGDGIDNFIQYLDMFTYTESLNDGFSALAYKIKYNEQDNRLVFLKILSGNLNVKDDIYGNKVNSIRIYNGSKYVQTDSVSSGMLCAVTGLNNINSGDLISDTITKVDYKTTPSLISKVIYDDNVINSTEILKCFKILEDEDPSMKIYWDNSLNEFHIYVMGAIQLEIIKEIVFKRFGLNVDFGKCKVLYKETIADTVIGYGHFEPLRHYAEAHIKIMPAPRNSGISFKSECSFDILDSNFQNLIKSHIFEKQHKGVLTGSPFTDVKFILINGRAHIKHTEGGDFREAVYRAVRQGLEKAKNILLEPLYKFKITVSASLTGRIISDIQSMYGTFEMQTLSDDIVIIRGLVPISEFLDYSIDFMSLTKGRGSLTVEFGGYDICHNSDFVIADIGYNKDSDTQNTSSSVFCSKGSGFIVKWDSVEDYIHCK